jgi:hypothetical protein
MSIYRRTDRAGPNDARVDPGPQHGPPADQGTNWTKRRVTEPANGLLKPTVAWASTLPVEVCPRALLARFPRIANLIAAMWPDPNSFRRYVDDLLVDKRGNRQGFPVDVLKELFELRAYFDDTHPDAIQPWDVMSKSD